MDTARLEVLNTNGKPENTFESQTTPNHTEIAFESPSSRSQAERGTHKQLCEFKLEKQFILCHDDVRKRKTLSTDLGI